MQPPQPDQKPMQKSRPSPPPPPPNVDLTIGPWGRLSPENARNPWLWWCLAAVCAIAAIGALVITGRNAAQPAEVKLLWRYHAARDLDQRLACCELGGLNPALARQVLAEQIPWPRGVDCQQVLNDCWQITSYGRTAGIQHYYYLIDTTAGPRIDFCRSYGVNHPNIVAHFADQTTASWFWAHAWLADQMDAPAGWLAVWLSAPAEPIQLAWWSCQNAKTADLTEYLRSRSPFSCLLTMGLGRQLLIVDCRRGFTHKPPHH